MKLSEPTKDKGKSLTKCVEFWYLEKESRFTTKYFRNYLEVENMGSGNC